MGVVAFSQPAGVVALDVTAVQVFNPDGTIAQAMRQAPFSATTDATGNWTADLPAGLFSSPPNVTQPVVVSGVAPPVSVALGNLLNASVTGYVDSVTTTQVRGHVTKAAAVVVGGNSVTAAGAGVQVSGFAWSL